MKSYFDQNCYELAWDKFGVGYTHEFELEGITFTSTLDHFIWNENFSRDILDAGVAHFPNNTSDHSPIYCTIQRGCTQKEKPGVNSKSDQVSTKMFTKEDWDTFSAEMELKLQNLTVPSCIGCRNVHCQNDQHKLKIDSYVAEVLKTLDGVGISSGKRGNQAHTKVVARWSDVFKPFREEAKFWNAVWISAGKPINNALHHAMKRTRNVYHYAIRKCKRAAENIKKDKLMKSCLSGKKNIFDELRKMWQVYIQVLMAIQIQQNLWLRCMVIYTTRPKIQRKLTKYFSVSATISTMTR